MRLLGPIGRLDRSGLFAASLAAFAALGTAQAAIGVASAHTIARSPTRATSAPLIFGIYPGGGAGTVGPSAAPSPEDPARRLTALRELRAPGHPFVLRIYATYSGPGSSSSGEQVGRDIVGYTQAGFEVELVLAYRPLDANPRRDVPGFAEFARGAVRSFGANPDFVSLQVTNEANVRNAPNAADGFYAGVQDALIQGVIAAKQEARADGLHQVEVGMNWAYSTDRYENAFWRALGARGGAAFRRSLDWVGLDVYPGTWGPRITNGDPLAATRRMMSNSLTALRRHFMPLAGLRPSMPLHISENGYPTGPGRSQAVQVAVMRAAIATVSAERAVYHITDYRWFDLRDADSASASFEEHYGLMRDDYSPKPAFFVYRDLVTALGAR